MYAQLSQVRSYAENASDSNANFLQKFQLSRQKVGHSYAEVPFSANILIRLHANTVHIDHTHSTSFNLLINNMFKLCLEKQNIFM